MQVALRNAKSPGPIPVPWERSKGGARRGVFQVRENHSLVAASAG